MLQKFAQSICRNSIRYFPRMALVARSPFSVVGFFCILYFRFHVESHACCQIENPIIDSHLSSDRSNQMHIFVYLLFCKLITHCVRFKSAIAILRLIELCFVNHSLKILMESHIRSVGMTRYLPIKLLSTESILRVVYTYVYFY